MLAALSRAEQARVAAALEEVRFSTGDEIVRQGDREDAAMYIMWEGKAAVEVGGARVDMTYGKGEYLGT